MACRFMFVFGIWINGGTVPGMGSAERERCPWIVFLVPLSLPNHFYHYWLITKLVKLCAK